MPEGRSPISPTAHYTGAVWSRNGLSHPALATTTGRLMFESLRLPMTASKLLGGTRLEDFLLARHLLIDELLEAAIANGEISQVIEIASGLSPRGWRFTQRHGDRVTYIETDLPEMAERKRSALRGTGSLGPEHRIEVLDALAEGGESSLGAIAAKLDPTRGVAILTEGLLTYLDRDSVLGLWRRAAQTLSTFPHGLMLSDLHLAGDNDTAITRLGVRLLSMFVRGSVEMHFDDAAQALGALRSAGFAEASLHSGAEASTAPGADSIQVIEAST